MKKYKVQCVGCGKMIDDNGQFYTEEGDSYCDKCAAIMQEVCCCCGEKDQTWNMSCTSQDEMYCERCATAIA